MTDENDLPVAVQIDYDDWLKIEQALDLAGNGRRPTDLSSLAGTLKWTEDAVAYQRRVREEWFR